jgi:Fe2+ transport system protein FeoA
MECNMKHQSLSQLKRGQLARIVAMDQDAVICHKLMNLGVLPMKTIRFVKPAPMGDPLEFEVDGRNFSVRRAEANSITVEPYGALG